MTKKLLKNRLKGAQKVAVDCSVNHHGTKKKEKKKWKSNHRNNPIQPPPLHHKLKNKKPIKVIQDAVLSGSEAPSPTSNATTTTRHYFRSLSLSSTTKQNSNNYRQQKANQNKSKRSEWEKQRVGANLPHVVRLELRNLYIYISFLNFPISLIAISYWWLRVVMMFVPTAEWPCWWRQSSVVVLRCVSILIFIILVKWIKKNKSIK